MTKTKPTKPQGAKPATKKPTPSPANKTATKIERKPFCVKLGVAMAYILTDRTTGAARLEVAPPWGPEITDELADLGVVVEWDQFDMDTGFGAHSDEIPADKIDAVRKVLTSYARHIYA